MSEQPIELSLVRIELLHKTLLHCVTANGNILIGITNVASMTIMGHDDF